MENQVLINSIYLATEGEGVFIGRPQVFVRFQGCNIGCLNCDSMDTWDFDKSTAISITEASQRIEKAANYKIKNVSITGGDPLHPKHKAGLLTLLNYLRLKNFYINIEAAGTRIDEDIFNLCDYISFDFKTPSTGVKFPIQNIVKMAKLYEGKFQVKAVIQDEKDFLATLKAKEFIESETGSIDFPWCLTPAFMPNEEFSSKRFIEILMLNQDHGAPFRVIGQQHKWVYGPDLKEV